MSKNDKASFEQELNISKYFPFPTYQDWKAEAEKLLKGAPFDKILKTETYEGITLDAIYNAQDIADIPYIDSLPSFPPYTIGTATTAKIKNGWDVQQELEASSIEEWNQNLLHDLQRGQNSFRLKLDKPSSKGKPISEIKVKHLFKGGLPIYNYSDFCRAIQGVCLESTSFDIETGVSIYPIYVMLHKACKDHNIDMSKLQGSITGDFLRVLLRKGHLPHRVPLYLDEIAKVTKHVLVEGLNLKTILIDMSVLNSSGSSAVEDLGVMAAAVTFYAEELQMRKIKIEDIFSQMTFIFAVNNNLFMEIAKLRAARFIFAKLAEAYGVKEENAKMRMHVRTSEYTKTIYDPWVNILRTTTEAFSAVLGGCDSLHVTPFDNPIRKADDFSRRIARNQQLVLLEEAHLNAVNDPAGGSYYVEALTQELIQKSWEFFLKIEERDGLIECLQDATIQNRISKTHAARVKNAETRKDVIVGTSTFPNLQEKKLEGDSTSHDHDTKNAPTSSDGCEKRSKNMNPFWDDSEELDEVSAKMLPESKGGRDDEIPPDFETHLALIDKYSLDNFLVASRKNLTSYISPLASILHGDGTYMEKMKKRRLTESFENLRETVENITPRPEVFVANVGKVIKNKPRVDFAISFFEPAGFVCKTNDGFENVDAAIEGVLEMTTQIIVLSSTDDLYPEIVPVFAKALKEKAPEKILALAGYPKEHIETFTGAGVDFFVYMRANLVETINSILKKLGGDK